MKHLAIVLCCVASVLLTCKSNSQANSVARRDNANEVLEFSPYENLQADSIQITQELLILMQQASKPFSMYKEEYAAIANTLALHYEATKKLPNTELIIAQWDIFYTESKETLLLTTFMREWERKEILDDKSIQIGIGNVRLITKNIIALEQRLIDSEADNGVDSTVKSK